MCLFVPCACPSASLEDPDFAAAVSESTSGTKPKSKRAAKKAVPKEGESPLATVYWMVFMKMRLCGQSSSKWSIYCVFICVGVGEEPCIKESAEELSARATLIICPLSVLSNWLVRLFLFHTPTHQNTLLLWFLSNSIPPTYTHTHNVTHTPHVCSVVLNRTSLSSTCVPTCSSVCTCTTGRSATEARPSWPPRTWCWPPTTSFPPTMLWVAQSVLTPYR